MPPRKSTRRHFLQGRAVADAWESWIGPAPPLPPPTRQGGQGGEPQSGTRGLLRLSRNAMACEFAVLLGAAISEGPEHALAALDLVTALESQLTIYRETSEISTLNRVAAERAVPLEPALFGLLVRAIELHGITSGAFDITAGPLSQLWGFERRAGRVPAFEQLEQSLACVGSRHLLLDANEQSVRFALPGVKINLGAIGKGYALDRCAALLASAGCDTFLIHGGLSSVLARGACEGDERGWRVGLRHPLRPELRLCEIFLRDRALGTSGSGTQFFFHQGRRYGHILDPRNGLPAEGMLSATVLAPNAADADALATAFYILSPEESQAICESHDLSAILVRPGSTAGSIEVSTINLADDEWRLLVE